MKPQPSFKVRISIKKHIIVSQAWQGSRTLSVIKILAVTMTTTLPSFANIYAITAYMCGQNINIISSYQSEHPEDDLFLSNDLLALMKSLYWVS